MRRLHVFWVFLNIAICFHVRVGLGATIVDNGENLNITKVLETNETLWLYWETTKHYYDICPNGHCIEQTDTCTRNIKDGFSDKYYNFTQIMQLGKTQVGTPYMGKFVNDTHPPKSMRVTSPREHDEPHLYTLEFTDEPSYNCSVFYIFSLSNRISKFELETCQMYIRDSAVDYGPSESCQIYFKQRCNRTKTYQPYKPECKQSIANHIPTEINTNFI